MPLFQTLHATEIAPLYEWGLEVIRFMQSYASPLLTNSVLVITNLSSKHVYMVILLYIFWCVNLQYGFILSYSFFGSFAINTFIKNILQVPRPYMLDPSVAIITHEGFSTPSGHAQMSATFFPLLFLMHSKFSVYTTERTFLFHKMKKEVSLFFALVIPFLIGCSRVYLGVHFPTDVFFGWMLGALIVMFVLFSIPEFLKNYQGLYAKVQDMTKRGAQTSTLIPAAVISFFSLLLMKEDSSVAGIILGLAIGKIYILDAVAPNFDESTGSLAKKITRLILGICIYLLALFCLKQIFSLFPENLYRLLRFIRYGTAGILITGIMPLIFIKLHLVEEPHASN